MQRKKGMEQDWFEYSNKYPWVYMKPWHQGHDVIWYFKALVVCLPYGIRRLNGGTGEYSAALSKVTDTPTSWVKEIIWNFLTRYFLTTGMSLFLVLNAMEDLTGEE